MTTELLPSIHRESLATLRTLLAPMGMDEFFGQILGRRPAHARPDTDRDRSEWFSKAALLNLVVGAGLSTMDIRMAVDGNQLDIEDYTTRVQHHDGSEAAVAAPDLIMKLYQGGATVLLENLDRYHPPSAARARTLEQCLGCTLKTNAFLTPRGANAFPLHSDNYDGIIVQVEGRKRWKLYAAAVELPLRTQRNDEELHDADVPILDVTLEAGDMLYVPRGVPHRAEALDEDSLHLTFIPVWNTWYDVLERLIEVTARSNINLRHSYDPNRALESADELIELLATDTTIQRCFDELATDFAQARRPHLNAMARTAQERDLLDEDCLLKACPESVVAVTRTDDRGVHLRWSNRSLSLAADARPVVERLLAGAPVSVASISPQGTNDAVRTASILLDAGLIELERGVR